jgi:uncharacterized membrane protein
VKVRRSKLKQATLKTITFRIVASSIDFTINYIFIGDFAAAAGLSAFALVALPILYFVHELIWNHLVAKAKYKEGRWGSSVELPLVRRPVSLGSNKQREGRTVTVHLALTKALTYRTAATTLDFGANLVVVNDLAAAAALSAVGLIIGPFVYLGHEMAWARSSRPGTSAPADISVISAPRLPAPVLS